MTYINYEPIIKKLESKTFNLLSLFFFGTVLLFIGIILFIFSKPVVAFVLGLVGVALYYYLFIIFTSHLIILVWGSFKEYYKVYIYSLLSIFVAFILYGIYYYFDGFKGIIGFLATIISGVFIYYIPQTINKLTNKNSQNQLKTGE